jgi:hypothetical protein
MSDNNREQDLHRRLGELNTKMNDTDDPEKKKKISLDIQTVKSQMNTERIRKQKRSLN